MRLSVDSLDTLDAAIAAGEYSDYLYMYPPRQAYRRLGDLSRVSGLAGRKLVAARLLSSTDIIGVVRGSAPLRELVARPLFARMLTYVGVGDGASVNSATHLYEKYLDRLASSCQTSLRDAGIEVSLSPARIWELAGQVIFENRLIIDEELNYSAAERIIVHETGVSSQAIRRAMAYLLDIREKGAVKYAQFVHYSFFEYLVSAALYERLATAEGGDAVGTLAQPAAA